MIYEADDVKKKTSYNKDFWDEYRSVVLSRGIPEKKTEWYVKWAQRFAYSIHSVPLHSRTSSHVTAFLIGLQKMDNIKIWQMEQATSALKILCQEFLQLSWSMNWQSLIIDSIAARTHQQKHPNIASFRDSLSSCNVDGHNATVLKCLKTEIRTRHYALSTERTYDEWVRRFIVFHRLKPISELGPSAVKEYLEYLADVRIVTSSTQNQALNALVFLYEQVLKEPLGMIGDFTRAKRPKRLPVVMTRDEVKRLLAELTGTYALIAGLLYGGGLRLMECLRMRIKDIDFEQNHITVRDGKGKKDRIRMLTERFHEPLKEQIKRIKKLHDLDISKGVGEVYIWSSLERKYPKIAKEWIWQYVFPSDRLSIDPRSQKIRKHHLHERSV
jgi:integron integrase